MELHETLTLGLSTIRRVPNGWIYYNGTASTYVPDVRAIMTTMDAVVTEFENDGR
jgi:hypothetical protein